MISRNEVYHQCERITTELVRTSLCDQQNYPIMKSTGRKTWLISGSGMGGFSIAMRNIEYRKIYDAFSNNRIFNFKMIDGALVQMLYEFEDDKILNHRLAFFPSPDLDEYQNAPDIYEQEEIYADIIEREIVPFPIRFDFEASSSLHLVIDHPKSHMTLGQYKNCRIPVSGPITPFVFIQFLLRNFYNTAFKKHSDSINFEGDKFTEDIHFEEKGIPHLCIPTAVS